MKPVHENQTGHETFIPMLCKLVGARSYLEIGIFDGCTLRNVAVSCPQIECVGVDPRRLPKNEQRTALERLHGRTIPIFQISSDEYFKNIAKPGQTFDIIFIDASHKAEDVWRDLRNALKHSPEHGLILLHDTYPKDEAATSEGYCGTAWEVADALEHPHLRPLDFPKVCLETVTLPYHPGLTIIRKRSKHLAW